MIKKLVIKLLANVNTVLLLGSQGPKESCSFTKYYKHHACLSAVLIWVQKFKHMHFHQFNP